MQNKLNIFIELEFDDLEDKPAERQLLAAMLDRVIRDRFETERGILREVDSYIHRKLVKNPIPYSFQWICEHLDLDPVFMRYFVKTRTRENYNPT